MYISAGLSVNGHSFIMFNWIWYTVVYHSTHSLTFLCASLKMLSIYFVYIIYAAMGESSEVERMTIEALSGYWSSWSHMPCFHKKEILLCCHTAPILMRWYIKTQYQDRNYQLKTDISVLPYLQLAIYCRTLFPRFGAYDVQDCFIRVKSQHQHHSWWSWSRPS